MTRVAKQTKQTILRSGPGAAGILGGLAMLACVLVFAASASAGEFGFREGGFVVSVTNRDGSPDTQAGSHPYAFATTIAQNLETVKEQVPLMGSQLQEIQVPAGGVTRDIEVSLPAGMVGDPLATPQCSLQP